MVLRDADSANAVVEAGGASIAVGEVYRNGYSDGMNQGYAGAYADGWAAAIATLKISGSGNTATATVGGDQFGSASKSITATPAIKNHNYTASTLSYNGKYYDSKKILIGDDVIVYTASSHTNGAAYISNWS